MVFQLNTSFCTLHTFVLTWRVSGSLICADWGTHTEPSMTEKGMYGRKLSGVQLRSVSMRLR